jgi:hypothetical protein
MHNVTKGGFTCIIAPAFVVGCQGRRKTVVTVDIGIPLEEAPARVLQQDPLKRQASVS